MITTSITSSWRRALLALAAATLLGTSCQRELVLPDVTVPDGQIVFGSEGLDLSVETKATAVTSLSSFYVSAVTGSAGSESSAWNSVQFSQVPGSSPASYAGGKYWPASNPGYKFYGSNVALNFAAGGTYVNASNATDVVCAYLSSPTYNTKNTLSFEHIFARLCRVDVAAQTGYTISNIRMYITPKTGGTYNLRTGAGHTDGTGWSSVATGSATLISNKTGATNNDIYMVPGTYSITCSWVSTDPSGASVTHTNESSTLPIKGGATNNISVVLGGDILLGVDLQDYCEYDYRDNLDYLTFYCDEAGTIGWKCTSPIGARTIQYSKNFGATWTNLTSTTSGATIAVNAGDIVWFKGSNTEYAGEVQDGLMFYTYNNTFTLSNKAHVYGNVNSLTGNNTSVSDYCFHLLFENCSNLYTYETKKIILPATTLATYCYCQMFSGCTSLTIAPVLPATTLATYCYDGMFYNCTSLTSAPDLPATTLAKSCYSSMFYNCISLTSAPELPATTLAERCYSGMFQRCSSLTTAPELPATTLASRCYHYMLYGCSSLNYIKALFTTIPSSSYTNNWVSGVAHWGVFVKSSDATWDVVGNNGVPTGWTVVSPPIDAESLAIPGEFSISSTEKVKFAKGNLQAVIGTGISDYRATASEWKFAGHQYDIIGAAAGNTSFAVGTTVDLFGWVGASASYDSYGLCTNSSTNNAYYGTSASDALKTDWGSIPDIETWIGSGWHTLTSTQWNYLFTQRTNASSLYGQCQITTASGTVAGMLILPDNWTKPSNCTVTPGTGAFDRVTYSATAASGASNAWVDMEAAGAVFLPAAGYRYGAGVGNVGSYGYYWSSSVFNGNNAYSVYFGSGRLYPQSNDYRSYAYSVRLVKDAN